MLTLLKLPTGSVAITKWALSPQQETEPSAFTPHA